MAQGWNATWCSAQCDNCSGALGITRIFNGCSLTGIRAIGSQFEDAENFTWRLDFNRDGVLDASPETVETNFLPAGVLGNGIVNARVDVGCDGFNIGSPGSFFPWENANTWVEITPSPDFQRPTATISAPNRTNGYYYNSGATVCFTASNIAYAGYTFLGWSVNGGSPATQGPGSLFCTQLTSSFTTPGNLRLSFRNNCSGAVEVVNGPFFLICPNGRC